MKLWSLLLVLSAAYLQAGEPKFYRGVCLDKDWPHRYVIEIREDKMAIHVEQRIDVLDDSSEWFSWSGDVKIAKVKNNKINFGCPWGVPGKLLPVDCVIEFNEIKEEGFKGKITVTSFEKDNQRDLKFARITKKELAPSIQALTTQAEQGGVE